MSFKIKTVGCNLLYHVKPLLIARNVEIHSDTDSESCFSFFYFIHF